MVLHAQGKLEPLLRAAAGEALQGGEAALAPPVGSAAVEAAERRRGKRKGCVEKAGEPPVDVGGRPPLNRSLSA